MGFIMKFSDMHIIYFHPIRCYSPPPLPPTFTPILFKINHQPTPIQTKRNDIVTLAGAGSLGARAFELQQVQHNQLTQQIKADLTWV